MIPCDIRVHGCNCTEPLSVVWFSKLRVITKPDSTNSYGFHGIQAPTDCMEFRFGVD